MKLNLSESYLSKIVNESINKVINEGMRDGLTKVYWVCEFEDSEGNTSSEMIYAKTTVGAFRHATEKAMRLGMEPKFETLRNATMPEIKEFQKMIKNRLKNKGEV